MFQALIVLLREGVEAALVIGIAVAYLRKTGRDSHIRSVYLALAAAVAGSLALGYAFARLQWNQEKFEGWIMLAAAAMVITLAAWLRRAGAHVRDKIEAGLTRLQDAKSSPFAVFTFVFLLVLREGVETVLMLSATSLSSEGVATVAGAATGLALAIVFGVLFVRGSLRINLRLFFRTTTVILMFVAGQLIVSGLHELSEQGVLPSSKTEMALIGPIVRNDVFFFVAMMALAGMMVLMDWRSRPAAMAAAAAVGGNSAERRKASWQARRERTWMASVCISTAVFMVVVTAEFIYAKSQTSLSASTVVEAQDGIIRIPLSEIAGGKLHRFSFGKVRFIIIERPGMEPGVALDACEICGDVGYYQRGPSVFCKNCSAAMFIPSIGVAGGCNPIPFAHRVENGQVLIEANELQKQARWFGGSPH